ncbi:MAG: hypothetical protein HQ463_03605 [Bacteroidetes bacterium]|nr:hypothetical protein [Bacteroidota bacterium]
MRNSAIINYNIQYKKSVINTSFFNLCPNANLRIGSLHNDISVWLSTSIGNKPFVFIKSSKKVG